MIAVGQPDVDDLYIPPTVVDFGRLWNVDKKNYDESMAMADEIFGPIMPVIRYKNIDNVIRTINKGEKPLAMYIFSDKTAESDRILRETTAGHAVVNDVLLQFSAPIPFGGIGKTGMGAYHGKWSMKAFSHEKGVLWRHL